MDAQRIVLVVGDYEGNLRELSSRAHVWIEKTPINSAAAHDVWNQTGGVYSQGRGVTVFNALSANRFGVRNVTDTLISIDEHHQGDGEFIGPWQEIQIMGLTTDEIGNLLGQLPEGMQGRQIDENGTWHICRGSV